MLVGKWTFNNTNKDLTDNPNKDAYINGASYVNGMYSKMLQFDNDSEYVDLPEMGKYIRSHSYSFQCIIKLDQIGSSFDHVIYSDMSGGNSWQESNTLRIYNTGLYVYQYDQDTGSYKYRAFDGSSYLNTTDWLTLQVTCGGFDNYAIKMYINGNELAVVNEGGNPGTSGKSLSENLRIGRLNGYSTDYSFRGIIGNIQIHDKSISLKEIKEYSKCMAARWKMNIEKEHHRNIIDYDTVYESYQANTNATYYEGNRRVTWTGFNSWGQKNISYNGVQLSSDISYANISLDASYGSKRVALTFKDSSGVSIGDPGTGYYGTGWTDYNSYYEGPHRELGLSGSDTNLKHVDFWVTCPAGTRRIDVHIISNNGVSCSIRNLQILPVKWNYPFYDGKKTQKIRDMTGNGFDLQTDIAIPDFDHTENSYEFTSQHLYRIYDPNNNPVAGSTQMTAIALAKFSSTGNDASGSIVSSWSQSFLMGYSHGGACYISDGSNSDSIQHSTWTDDTWHVFCMVYNGTTGRFEYWIDGEKKTYKTTTVSHLANLSFIKIGATWSTAMTGNIKDVRIYGKDLSESEIIEETKSIINSYSKELISYDEVNTTFYKNRMTKYMPLYSDANDISRFKYNNYTITGSPTFTNIGGKDCMLCDVGVEEGIQLDYDLNLRRNPYTLYLEVYIPSSYGSSYNYMPIYTADGTNGGFIYLYNDYILYQLNDGDNRKYDYSTQNTILRDSWNTIALTLDGEISKLYLNGNHIVTGIHPDPWMPCIRRIGYSYGFTYQFEGYIRRVIEFDKALDGDEITKVINEDMDSESINFNNTTKYNISTELTDINEIGPETNDKSFMFMLKPGIDRDLFNKAKDRYNLDSHYLHPTATIVNSEMGNAIKFVRDTTTNNAYYNYSYSGKPHLYGNYWTGGEFPSDELTLCFWINTDFTNMEVPTVIFDNYHSGRNHFFLRSYAYGQLQFYAQGTSGYIGYGGFNNTQIPFSEIDNKWLFVAMRWRYSDQKFNTYFGCDGEDWKHSTDDIITESTWTPNRQQFWFGGQYDGLLTNIRLYHKFLDESDIKFIYQLENPYLNKSIMIDKYNEYYSKEFVEVL